MSTDYRNALLSELYEFQYGNGNTIEDIGGDYPIYGSNGIVGYTNKFNSEDAPVIGHIGAYAGIVNWADGKHFVTYNGVICRIKPNINSKYGYYCLLNSNLQSRLRGSTQPFVSYDLLNEVKIYLPNIQTQKSIAKVLSDLDAKIELNNKINRELEAMAKTLYDYWFVQFDFPNEQGKPYKSSGGKMVYNEELKREIPEGWEVKRFGDYARVKSGFAFKSNWWQNKGIPVLKIKDIKEDYTLNLSDFSFVSEDKIKIASNFKSSAGDVVIAMTGATIGKFAIIPYTDKPILINQRVGLYDLGDKRFEKLPFLVNSMKQDFFRLKVFQMSGGAAQPNISGEQLDEFPLIYPNTELVNKYNENFISSYKRIANNIKQNQQLTELRDWLLPMLMNGQVTVGEEEENPDSYRESMAAEQQAEYKKG